MAMLSGCVRETADENIPKIGEADRLVVFTSHKPEVYEPIIREFEKTTSIWVEVVSGGTNELLERLRESGSYEADVMFGGGVESLGAFADCFESIPVCSFGYALESFFADFFKPVKHFLILLCV